MARFVRKRAPAKLVTSSSVSLVVRSKCCALCNVKISRKIDTPIANRRDRHAFIPMSQRKRKGVFPIQSIRVCLLCRRAVNAYFTEVEQADHLYTTDLLKSALQDVGWFEKRPLEPRKNKLYSRLIELTPAIEAYKTERFAPKPVEEAAIAVADVNEPAAVEAKADGQEQVEKASRNRQVEASPSPPAAAAQTPAQPSHSFRRTALQFTERFASLEELVKHSERMHASKRHACRFPGCSKTYVAKTWLEKHHRDYHKMRSMANTTRRTAAETLRTTATSGVDGSNASTKGVPSPQRKRLPTSRDIVKDLLRRSPSGEARTVRERDFSSANAPTDDAVLALQPANTAKRSVSTPVLGKRVKRIRQSASPSLDRKSGSSTSAQVSELQERSAIKSEAPDVTSPSTSDGSKITGRKRVPRVDIMLKVESKDLEHLGGLSELAAGGPVDSAKDSRGDLRSQNAIQIKTEEAS